MASTDHSMEFSAPGKSSPHGPKTIGAFWLDGDVLACACPGCGSPMSIRLWLMLADCWRCNTSIELTEEQEQEALRLLESHGLLDRSAVDEPPPAPAPADLTDTAPTPQAEVPTLPASPVKWSNPVPTPHAVPRAHVPQPRPVPPVAPSPPPTPVAQPGQRRRRLAAEKPGRIRSQLNEIAEQGALALWMRECWRSLPAWLISLLVHMALLILLATVWLTQFEPTERPLILSTHIDTSSVEGDLKDELQTEPIEFADSGEPEPSQEFIEQPLNETQLAFDTLNFGEMVGNLEPGVVTPGLPGGGASMFAGRDPEARTNIALQEGGTIESEAAVTRGLEWLARNQNSDGSWSLDGAFSDPGAHSDTAATAMALLPFLGAGETHLRGRYKKVVQRGLHWLVKNQEASGSLMGRGIGRMYAHGQATIVLCEAYALTQDSKLRAPAQLAVDFIVRAQHSEGGWRYVPGERGDTSVVGWQLMALRSAQMAYLDVPSHVFERANQFLDRVQTESDGSFYAYTRGHPGTFTMTAEALLCRQYSGWPATHPALLRGARRLITEHPPNPNDRQQSIYYWYYATQMMHHLGGTYWEAWNSRMRDMLVATQVKTGREAGSWTPQGPHSSTGGRLYQTALSICTLEVYYRHMPLYRSVATE